MTPLYLIPKQGLTAIAQEVWALGCQFQRCGKPTHYAVIEGNFISKFTDLEQVARWCVRQRTDADLRGKETTNATRESDQSLGDAVR